MSDSEIFSPVLVIFISEEQADPIILNTIIKGFKYDICHSANA